MKPFYLSLIFSFFTFSVLSAQSRLHVTKVGLTSGYELDAVQGLGENYFVQGIRDQMSPDLVDLRDFDKRINDMFCENATMRLHLALEHDYMPNWSFNVGFYKIYDRFDAVEYTFNNRFDSFESLDYKSLSHEAGLEFVVQRTLPIFKFFSLHGGIGSQMGYGYKSRLNVSHVKNITEPLPEYQSVVRNSDREIIDKQMIIEEEYQMKNSWSQKSFLQAGFSLILIQRLEFGLLARYGLGHRFLGGLDHFTKLESMNFRMAYRLG